ncbi:hypothetical protein LC048_01955 [Mesobacillus subterraneus]|uniref:hypothetical protein n=1 Tax=Mesobacillus subterraneus TaxID=285983 RepID=UPI001CFDC4B1|nr:hypothetical protein [Mesobacillus subterraneus]WLR55796.1 hypothetical protein LC048_01955 [Mesobacillus subterraneus]
MVVISWIAIAYIIIYYVLFGITLWRQKNKIGSAVVIFLALACIALHYISF